MQPNRGVSSADQTIYFRKNEELAEQDEHVEEQVPTVLSPTEPSAGEKRSREDDPTDGAMPSHDAAHVLPANQALPQPSSAPLLKTESSDVKMNGTHPNPPAAGGQIVNGATAGYDALYIGDLQWVRLSSRLVSCGYGSEIPSLYDACLLCSGRQMKICAKSP